MSFLRISRAPGRAGLRFVLALFALAVVVLIVYREEVVGPAVVPLRILTARTVLILLHGLGVEAAQEASAIYHPGGFAFEISRGCMGLVPALFLGAAIAAYPGSLIVKLAGWVGGIPLLLMLNFARLVHLFYLGVYRPELFELAHRVVWEGAIILAVITLWLVWVVWADRGHTEAYGSSSSSTRLSTAVSG